ncbi:MAG TPA: DUF5069 domain-containing protein [Opitutaceae bacterium]|jgi:hypothetical protein
MATLQSAYTSPTAAAPAAVNLSAPDLTRHPPRSPRTKLGGYVQLPRLLDKARATVSGKNGDFHYDCPIDKRFFDFTGLKADAFLEQVKAGKSDSEILAYVQSNTKRQPFEIAAWSTWFDQLTPGDPDTRAFINEVHKKNAAGRGDIVTWFDWLELDDFVTYGGKP